MAVEAAVEAEAEVSAGEVMMVDMVDLEADVDTTTITMVRTAAEVVVVSTADTVSVEEVTEHTDQQQILVSRRTITVSNA